MPVAHQLTSTMPQSIINRFRSPTVNSLWQPLAELIDHRPQLIVSHFDVTAAT